MRPHKLRLLPGLKWQGHLIIIASVPDGYAVQFDATGIDSGMKQHIYDRAVLSARQLKDWTGYRESEATGRP